MKIKRSKLLGNFTQVPNEVLDNDLLCRHPSARLALVDMYRDSGREFSSARGFKGYVTSTGRNYYTWRSYPQIWKQSGLVRFIGDDIELFPFDGEPEPIVQAPVAEVVTEQPAKDIAEEVAEAPRRESTGLSQKDRWELIKKAWNQHKPDGYMQLDGSVVLPLLIAIETQTKRLKVDRDDYDAFIGAVLRGAKADDWWGKQAMKATAVFGFGANLDNRKFENVEKLYRQGLRIPPAAAPAGSFDFSDDKKVLDYAAPRRGHKSVLRLRLSSAALVEAAYSVVDFERYVKDAPGRIFDWKVQEQAEYHEELRQAGVEVTPDWYDKSVFMMFYEGDAARPSYWLSGALIPR